MNGFHKRREGFLALGVILVLIPLFVESPYYIHLLIMAGMNAILAMTFILMLRSGLISLANSAFWGVGAYASALLTMRLDLSFWLALPLSAIAAGVVAFGVGYLLVRNPGFGFLIQTVVFGELAVLVFAHVPIFGGYDGIVSIPPVDSISPPFLATIEFTSKIPYYYLIVLLFFLIALAFSALHAAWVGRAWRAIGLNPHLAGSLGINPFRYRLISFVIGSAAAGLTGSFYAHYYGAIAPPTFNVFKAIYIQMFAILGGISFPIMGPVVGAFIMTVVPELLRIAKEIEPIFTGLLLILLVIFLPEGLLSLLSPKHRTGYRAGNLSRAVSWIRNALASDRRY